MSRDRILADVRAALGRPAGAPVPPVPASARVPPHQPAAPAAELDLLLAEIGKVGGKTQKLDPAAPAAGLPAALAELVRAEGIQRATCWQTPELQALRVAQILADLGVEIISPYAGKDALASCDLGVTGVDAAFPETGTLLLRSTADRPRPVSLLPRIHLALLRPEALRADLGPAFAELAGQGYFVFVTGPSRTADIELTVTIGVHGPQALHVWVVPAP